LINLWIDGIISNSFLGRWNMIFGVELRGIGDSIRFYTQRRCERSIIIWRILKHLLFYIKRFFREIYRKMDGLSNVELVNIVTAIIKRKGEIEYKDDNEKFEKLKSEFPDFSARYLMLFEMAIRNEEFDWNSFNYMINMRNKIINNEMTVEDASKKVGEDWFNKYIDVSKINKRRKI